MDKKQALELLDKYLQTLKITRQEHLMLIEALKVLHKDSPPEAKK